MAAMVAAYQSDEVFKAAIDGATSIDEVIRIAGDQGFVLTEEELKAAPVERDLTDAELEESSGGTMHISMFTCAMSITCVFPSFAIC